MRGPERAPPERGLLSPSLDVAQRPQHSATVVDHDPWRTRDTGACYADSVIRRANADDHSWITSVGALVYRELGDYDQVLPTWLTQIGRASCRERV